MPKSNTLIETTCAKLVSLYDNRADAGFDALLFEACPELCSIPFALVFVTHDK